MTASRRLAARLFVASVSWLILLVPIFAARGAISLAAIVAADDRSERVLGGRCDGMFDRVRVEADRGDLKSLELLAQMYDRGCGVDQNERHAGAVYKRILAIRPTDAMANGFLTLFGDGRQRDPDRAVAYFRDAVRQGVPFAANDLSYALSLSNDPMFRRESHHWSVVADRQGDMRSRVTLAIALLYGYDETPIDLPRGMQILREADLAQSAGADLELGLSYRDGIGVPVDERQAEHYLKRAVRLGNAYAGLFLGVFYCQFHNADAARADSVRLVEDTRARLYHRSDIEAGLAQVYILNVGVPPDYARAIPLLKDGVDGGLIDAMDNLAYLKFHGLGAPADFVGGIVLLRKAAALGDAYAKRQLAEIHVDASVTAAIPDNQAAEYEYQRVMQQQANPPNQMPYPGSPAYQSVNGQ